MVVHAWRHAEPRMHRFLKDRVAGRRKCRCLERTHCNSADRGVAVPFPIEGGAATRAKMKSDAVAAVGIALVDLPLAVEPHPLFGIGSTEMESRAGAAGTPCSGKGKPDPAHPWRLLEASRSGIDRFVPSAFLLLLCPASACLRGQVTTLMKRSFNSRW